MSVSGRGPADNVGVTRRAARVGMSLALDDQDPGSLAQHEAVAPAIERAAGGSGIVPVVGQRPGVAERVIERREQMTLARPADDDIGFAAADEAQGLADGLRSGGA